jgi:hypothetical protein
VNSARIWRMVDGEQVVEAATPDTLVHVGDVVQVMRQLF